MLLPVVYFNRLFELIRSHFHADDKRPGCAWSALVAGRKLWYFVKPGDEKHFWCGPEPEMFILDIRERQDLFDAAGVIEVIQEQGEIIFVPSGWYHQVHNLVRAFSVFIQNVCTIFDLNLRKTA